jgi:hypothetical protein
MLIMKKWLLAVGILTPFVLYGAHPVWRSLEPLMPAPTEGGSNLSKDEIDKMIKKATEKSASIKVDVEKARKDVLSAATFEPPGDTSTFKDILLRRASAAMNVVAFDDSRKKFVGDKEEFENLRNSQGELRTFESKLNAWFLGEVNENAINALKLFREDLIIPYSQAKASPVKVAEYEMRGRHAIAKAFSAQLLKEFNLRIEKNALPINPSDATPLLKGMDDLIDMCAQFARVYSNAPDQARKNPDMERKSIEMLGLDAEWQACKELSNLFSRDPVGMTPSDVADWFVKVGSFMSKLSTDSTKALIKQKVQQFCGAVIPEKLGLDDQVLKVDGTLFRRDQLQSRFRKVNAGFDDKELYKRLPLSSDPAGLNERTQGEQKFSPLGYEPSMIDTPGGAVPAERFKPTPRSAAAFDYFKARQQVPSENGWKRVVLDRMLEAAAESEKTPGQQWDPLSLPGVAKQKPYDVLQKLNAIRAAMTNLGTQSLFPDR